MRRIILTVGAALLLAPLSQKIPLRIGWQRDNKIGWPRHPGQRRNRADGRGDASDGQLLVTGRLYSLKRTLEENPDSDFTPYSSAWTYSA